MKTYGFKRGYYADYFQGKDCSGSQSRSMARARAKDKKILHRKARRTVKTVSE